MLTIGLILVAAIFYYTISLQREVLARTIEKNRRPDRIYAFTADVMTESVEEYKRHGFDGVLPKPINWKLLMSMINGTENQPDKSLSAAGK